MYSRIGQASIVTRSRVGAEGAWVPAEPFVPEETRCKKDCESCTEDCEAKTQKKKKEISKSSLSSGYIEIKKMARNWGVPVEQIRAWTQAGRLKVFCERDGKTFYSRTHVAKARQALMEEYAALAGKG